jgi:hypothetical protein
MPDTETRLKSYDMESRFSILALCNKIFPLEEAKEMRTSSVPAKKKIIACCHLTFSGGA